MSGKMSSDDLALCRNVVKTLTSERYKEKNYLFLQPFDLSQTPGYMDVVKKVIDLSTLSTNLEAGLYSTRSAFFQDCFTIFENAIAYHAGRDSKWIAKLAKEMLKVAQRERKNCDKKLLQQSSSSSSSPLLPETSGKSDGGKRASAIAGMLLPTKKNKKALQEVASKKEGGGTKLKLKIGSVGGSSSSSPKSSSPKSSSEGGTSTGTSTKPKVSIKLKGPSQGKQPPSAIQQQKQQQKQKKEQKQQQQQQQKKQKQKKEQLKLSQQAQQQQQQQSSSSLEEKKPKKPRLTLKLGKPKTPTASSASPPPPSKRSNTPEPQPSSAGTSSTKPTSPKSSPKNSSSTSNGGGSAKISIKMSGAGGSRGKELPKGVSPPKSETKKSSKKSAVPKKSPSGGASTPKSTSTAATAASASTSTSASASSDTKKSASASGSSASKSPKSSTSKSGTGKAASSKTSSGKASTTKVASGKTAAGKSTTPKSSAGSGSKATSGKSSSSKSTSKSSTGKSKLKTKISLKTSSSAASSSASAPSSATSAAPSQANRGMMIMTPPRKCQCSKVLSGLKRRRHKQVGWFLQPVSDKGIIQDYRAKIKNPMDLSTMQTKLDKNEYPTVSAFVLDLRRIFANCLRYNTSIKDSLRPVAVETLTTAEQLMTVFLAKPEHPSQLYPPLLFCWKLCLNVLDTLFNMANPVDGQPTALYFLHPVSFYCGGQFPPDYLEKVTTPMDFGTVTAKLIEGQYTGISQFEADCKLVIDNCNSYYGGRDDGRVFTEQAGRLRDTLRQQLSSLNRYVKSPAGESLKRQSQMSISAVHFPKPPIPLLLNMIEELRSLKYTDKATKITEPAMGHFEKPVSTSAFPDYTQHVQNPMDLQTIERKVKSAAYGTPEDFEFDFLLIFQNCIAYNAARKTDHLIALGKYGMKHFRKIFSAKMLAFDDPSSAASSSNSDHNNESSSSSSIRKAPPDGSSQQGPTKKLKLDSGVSRGKAGPRISLSSSQVSSAGDKTQPSSSSSGSGKAKSPKPSSSSSSSSSVNKLPKTNPPKANSQPKTNQPVPLHIAIAQVKEQFPLRRAVKTLQSWEAGCARFFKELMRHSWISAARPKFIFHVPVPVLFPELKEVYAAKIKKPMDLTTIECTLLAGNRYASPENFINDIALVFANAVKFNKDGRDVGDPLSCAYYDASMHLLRYSRWLSLELLSDCVEDSEHVDEPDHEGMPVTSWKLTTGNKKRARLEMESIVLKEPIDKSLEGDRYTWMEVECEKLLKALRHQSDLRYMTFFIQPNYPPDYAAFISKPMDWERCQKTLKKRHYNKFGDIIDDLRLIFSNALKYNARHAGTDTVSGRAYDAAKYMSTKLENAINKMMLTVSDRIERERIDHNNAEREIEAAERAEDERIRAQWKNESSKNGSGGDAGGGSGPDANSSSTQVERTNRVRSTRRVATSRHLKHTDFEIPFFDDEDDGQHERSYFEVVRQQKAMFEQQRNELSKMHETTSRLGTTIVFSRIFTQRNLAQKWVDAERKKLGIVVPTANNDGNSSSSSTNVASTKGGSNTSSTPTTTAASSPKGKAKSSKNAGETTITIKSKYDKEEEKQMSNKISTNGAGAGRTVLSFSKPSSVKKKLEQAGRSPFQFQLNKKKSSIIMGKAMKTTNNNVSTKNRKRKRRYSSFTFEEDDDDDENGGDVKMGEVDNNSNTVLTTTANNE